MQKKLWLCLLGVLLLAAPVFSGDVLKVRASQDYISTEVEIEEPFDSLLVDGDIDVTFEQDDKVSARVYGSENLVELVNVRVEGSTLHIGFDRPVVIRGRRDLQVRVTGPELAKIVVSDRGEVDVRRGLITKDLEIDASDRAEVSLSRVEA